MAHSSPTIRLATNADVLGMAKVHILSWRETYPGLLPNTMLNKLSISDQAIRWQRLLDHPHRPNGSILYVADLLNEVIGYGSCGEQRSQQLHTKGFTAEVTELYVLRRAQRNGVGSNLLRAMAGALVKRDHRAMCLWVLEDNEPARRFYERLGGTKIAERRGRLREVAYAWPALQQLATVQD